jgi:glutamate synthase (ferredoxin)
VLQVMIQGKPGQVGDELERQLFIVRKLIERAKTAAMPADVSSDFYVCTLSNRTIVYKGMLRSVVVGQFFKDLVNPDYETAFAIYHRCAPAEGLCMCWATLRHCCVQKYSRAVW